MPSQLTVTQIEALEQQYLNGTQAGLVEFYTALYNDGYGYAGLAEGVVKIGRAHV